MDKWIGVCMNIWTDGWMAEWGDVWMGWTDGLMDE